MSHNSAPPTAPSSARTWRWFIAQQVVVFATGAVALWLVSTFSGRRVHGLQDTPTGIDLAGYLLVAGAIVLLTAAMLRRALGDPQASLAWRPTADRLRDFLLAFLVGFGVNSLPWAVPALLGRVELLPTDEWRWTAIALGLTLAWMNALFEELTMRAFPMQILRARTVLIRLVVPAFAFALQHFVGEAPTIERFAYLAALGIYLGAAWLLRPHPWFSGGLHAGFFYATLVVAGRAEAGSWFRVRGDLGTAYAIADGVLVFGACALVLAVAIRSRNRTQSRG